MKTWLLVLVLQVSVVTMARGSLASAQQAQAELGPAIWSRVLRIKNENPRGHYPAMLYATIFEFAGILWFYSDTDGTQSLSLRRGELEKERADLAPLLRGIDVGFAAHEIVPATGRTESSFEAALPNGCFIESLIALRRVLERGETVVSAALLSYYGREEGAPGHTVLAYETAGGCFLVDAARAGKPFRLERGSLAKEARDVASRIASVMVQRARWLPVPFEGVFDPSKRWASVLPPSLHAVPSG